MLEGRTDYLQEAMRGALDTTQSVVDNERRILEAIFGLDKKDKHWPAIFVEFVAHAARNERVREKLNEMYQRWHRFTVKCSRKGEGRPRTPGCGPRLYGVGHDGAHRGSLMQSRLAPESVSLDKMIEPWPASSASGSSQAPDPVPFTLPWLLATGYWLLATGCYAFARAGTVS
jgi:hypothetical protein